MLLTEAFHSNRTVAMSEHPLKSVYRATSIGLWRTSTSYLVYIVQSYLVGSSDRESAPPNVLPVEVCSTSTFQVDSGTRIGRFPKPKIYQFGRFLSHLINQPNLVPSVL